jgi:hypothetical protein
MMTRRLVREVGAFVMDMLALILPPKIDDPSSPEPTPPITRGGVLREPALLYTVDGEPIATRYVA